MEFELDDYRTGKIIQKRRNLSCISEPGNYCKNNYGYNNEYNRKIYNNNINNNINEKTKTENNINNKTVDKPIYVNSNNNYLVTKLKKENENLRLKLSKYENNINNNNSNKFKPMDNKIRQKKNEKAERITKKLLSNKPLITKSSNNFSNFANNTYTNFYNSKENKYKTNDNISGYNIINKNINSNTGVTNSFISQNKNNNKSSIVKSLSVFRNTSNYKSKNKNKKIIYDKIKSNYKKIQNKLSCGNISNCLEIKMKDKNEDNIYNNININNLYNSRTNTLNNNINNNNNIKTNIFSWKKKIEKDKNNFNLITGNICNTDRKQTDANGTNLNNSNSKERTTNTNIYIHNDEFNLTWSRFPKKSIETSFDHHRRREKLNNEIYILSSKNEKMNSINNNRILTKINSKKESLNLNGKIENNINKIRKDVTPHKITINRRRINTKVKNKKVSFGNNNISVKNIVQENQKNNNYDSNMNTLTIDNNKNYNISNNYHEGDIYVHKKRSSEFGIETKNKGNNDYIELKKNNHINNKYNITINNINNCNYIRLIEALNKPELKNIKKKDK